MPGMSLEIRTIILFPCLSLIYVDIKTNKKTKKKQAVICLKTQMSKFSQDYGFKAAFLILDAQFLEKGLSQSLYMFI